MAEMKSIGELCQLINGYAFKPSDWSSEGSPIVRIQNLNNILAEFNYFNGKLDKKYYINNGALLFSWSGTPGTSFGAFIWNRGPAIINQHIFRVIPKKGINVFYLKYALDGKLSDIISKSHGGVGLQHITKKDLEKINISVPSLDVQNKIVMTLNSLENILKKRKQQLSKLDQLVRSRFIEMFGDLKSNQKKWNIVSFNDFAVIDTSMTTDFKKYADYPHIGIDCIEKNTGEIKNYRTVKDDNIISGKYIFTQQHIIYSKIRPNLNKVALPNFNGLCSADAYPILTKVGKCSRIFLAYVMRSEFFLEYILQFSMRTNLPKVNKKELQGFCMPLPPLPLQEQFAAFVQQIDKAKSAVKQSLETLETLKKSLMQEYFG